jgi:hypothetical protein
LVLGISQSGKSPDIVAVLAEAKRQNQLTAVITNNPASDLGQVGDFVIDLGAGPEKSVAATKTYTASLMAVAALSALLAQDEAWGSSRAVDSPCPPDHVERATTWALDRGGRGSSSPCPVTRSICLARFPVIRQRLGPKAPGVVSYEPLAAGTRWAWATGRFCQDRAQLVCRTRYAAPS